MYIYIYIHLLVAKTLHLHSILRGSRWTKGCEISCPPPNQLEYKPNCHNATCLIAKGLPDMCG